MYLSISHSKILYIYLYSCHLSVSLAVYMPIQCFRKLYPCIAIFRHLASFVVSHEVTRAVLPVYILGISQALDNRYEI